MKLSINLLFISLLITSSKICSAFVTEALIGIKAAKDILEIAKDIKTIVSTTWTDVESSSAGANNNQMPQILTRFKNVSDEIDLAKEKQAEAIKNFISLQLSAKRNDVTNTINTITARFQELQEYVRHQDNLEPATLLTFAEWASSPNEFSIYHLMDRLHLTIFGSAEQAGSNLFQTMALSYGDNEKCLYQQSTQQFIYSLYTDIALTELKGYTMLEFSWIILRAYGKGNYTQEAELKRNNYLKRTERTIKLVREVMTKADRIIWRCDPDTNIEGQTYEQVKRFVQGYIENEVDMSSSRECMQSCSAYGRTENLGCYMDQFCANQERCSGKIHDCYYAGYDMTACPSDLSSLRRYEYIKFDDLTAGNIGYCSRGESQAISWNRYIFWECNYCFCLCDDQNSFKTERYFNLRETLANVNENKVVTGVRFTKVNRIFHLQIQEGLLLPRGMIHESSGVWKAVDNYYLNDRGVFNNQDYFTLTYDARSIDLDDIESEEQMFAVTGVRFRAMGTHLNLEVRFTKFDFETGQLLTGKENSYWKSNRANEYQRSKLDMKDLNVPTRSSYKSKPDSHHNQFLQFTHSSLTEDAAQTTVPFIDTQDVAPKPAVPLAGIGIYHKGRSGYGGFLAPNVKTYNYAPHMEVSTKS